MILNNKKGSIKTKYSYEFYIDYINVIFPLITFPYVSRILLPEGTGKVAFATSVVSYFSMIGMLGIPTYGIRTCAKVRMIRINYQRPFRKLW